MSFITSLTISTDWKRDNYDSIFVIIDWLIEIVYYKPVKIISNALRLAKTIIDMIMCRHGFLDSILSNKGLFFISKF